MFLRFFFLITFLFIHTWLVAQGKYNVKEDLRSDWMTYHDGSYQPLGAIPFTDESTVYFQLEPNKYPGGFLRMVSDRPYFVFINGKLTGEFRGTVLWDLDSLSGRNFNHGYAVAIHQENINSRDLKTQVLTAERSLPVFENAKEKPHSYFRDFVVVAGLVIILLFLVALHLNPKLASDYFSAARILSAREAEDSQSSARLTSSSNVQFYILCSLMIGFYLLIILQNLPSEFALPVRFQASGFWSLWWQWLKLSTIIFYIFLLKIVIIFLLTRLFGMRGMARFHFFNWIRLLLIVFGAATILLFVYFISRGGSSYFFVVSLSIVVIALVGSIVVAFFKLSGRSEHSMFHLFSYICATEIIPLLITVKVLFQ